MLPQINNLTGAVFVFIKVFIFVGAVIYLIFASIIVKQAKTFSKNIRDKFNSLIITAAYAHLIAAAVLVFLVLIIL